MSSSNRTRISAIGIAVFLTLFAALKPITIDETVYHQYALQILSAPLDPLGFEVLWGDEYEPALHVLVPPLLPYWLAAAVAVDADRPWLWKLWLFPFALLLCLSLRSLLSRFAPGAESPLLFAIAIGPTVVPAFNLMLDIPALALGLSGLALFASRRGRDSALVCALAGAIAGLALLTKYTALAPLVAMLGSGALERRWRHALVAGAMATLLFVGWELWLLHVYGDSQLLHALRRPPDDRWSLLPSEAVVGWVSLFGALGIPAGLLALTSLGWSARRMLPVLLLAAVPFAWIASLDPRPATILLNPPRLDIGDTELAIFFGIGLVTVPIIIWGVVAGVVRASPGRRREATFLALWFLVEVGLSLAISPYLAGRRVIGSLLAGSLALAAASIQRPDGVHALRWVASGCVALGLLYGVADLTDARARRAVHEEVVAKLANRGFDPKEQSVWFVGHWGFRFYSERLGWTPLAAGRSELREGDFVLLVSGVHRQRLPGAFRAAITGPLAEVKSASGFPWSATPAYYLGAVPIRRQPQTQVHVRIHRALRSVQLPPLSRNTR